MLAGGIGYQIHGAGGRFELPDGRAVDIDVEPASGIAMFDVWRFQQFAHSLNLSPSDEDVERALAAAAASGDLMVVRPGWYALGAVRSVGEP